MMTKNQYRKYVVTILVLQPFQLTQDMIINQLSNIFN